MLQQKGFVLISVLIITTIATMLGFSQLRENPLQARIAGNLQKEINARLAAEKGVFDAFKVIKTSTSSSTIVTELAHLSETNQSKYALQNILWSGSETDSTLSFVSKGIFLDARSYLKTEIKLKSSGIFDSAIIACKSVRVWGSGIIDSYAGGPYSETTVGTDGNVSVIGGIENIIYKNSETIQGDISEYLGECDPLDIETKMTGIVNEGGIARTDFDKTDDFTDGNVYFYENFDIKNNDILITGDVVLYITGNLTTKNATFSLANGSSSLTIYSEGKISIDTNSNIFANKYVSSETIPLTVYSSNNASDAVTLSGNGQIYMNLYAPFGDVTYTGNGDIMGALRGKTIDISGNGGLHYDQTLVGMGDSGAPAIATYSAVIYYYPTE